MSRRGLARIGAAAILAALAAWALPTFGRVDPAMLEGALRRAGGWTPALFVLCYAAGTVLFLPGSLFSLAGGILFGPLWGTVLNLAGAGIGATAAFLIARHLAGDWVRRRTGGRLGRILDGAEREGWRFVALTRLVPLFPFNLLNYALGLTRIRLDHYVLASLICMAPGAAVYTWLGYAGREVATGSRTALRSALLALGLLAALAFLPRLVRRIRRPAAQA